jgi:hypothetical protein
MMLWKKLYNTVWLAFFSCVLIPRWIIPAIGLPLHILLGLVMLVFTQSNRKQLAALPVPDRLKRISTVTAGFAVFQPISGLALGAVLHFAPNLYVVCSAIKGIHIVCALTILAQASSVATAYDMWEEKEFSPTAASLKN